MFEAEHGEVVSVSKIRRRVPVEEYLRLQKRYAHLFGDPPRTDVIARLQAMADRNIRRFGLLEEEACMMDKPFAITLDVGSSLANKTGSWRTERPVYVDRLPPCNDACPAGENIQAWLYQAEEGGDGYERAWRKIMEDNPFPAVMGRVCYHPCETVCNRGAARRGGRDQLRRAVPRRRGDQAGLDGVGTRRAARASACSSSAPAPRGCPPPTTWPASATP